MKVATNHVQHYPLHLRKLLHYLGKLKIQIFCTYSADLEENAKKCILSAAILIPLHMQLCTLSVFMCFLIKILFSSLNTMLIFDTHCSDVFCGEFSVPQLDRKSKQIKAQCHENFYLQSVWSKTRYVKRRKYKNLLMNNKVRGDKNAICLHFLPYLLNICRKFAF